MAINKYVADVSKLTADLNRYYEDTGNYSDEIWESEPELRDGIIAVCNEYFIHDTYGTMRIDEIAVELKFMSNEDMTRFILKLDNELTKFLEVAQTLGAVEFFVMQKYVFNGIKA